jgi:hypothetical protein
MHGAVVGGGSPSGDQGLARHVAAEDALALLVRLAAAKQILLDSFEIEQLDQGIEGGGHGSSQRARVG